MTKHSKHLNHCDSLLSADTSKTSIEHPSSRIDVMMSHTVQAQMEEIKHILYQIVCAIMFLARQGLPVWGPREDIASILNPGNFLALLKSYAEDDSVLHDYLNKPKAKNATLLYPRSQNEINSVIGYNVIRAT